MDSSGLDFLLLWDHKTHGQEFYCGFHKKEQAAKVSRLTCDMPYRPVLIQGERRLHKGVNTQEARIIWTVLEAG